MAEVAILLEQSEQKQNEPTPNMAFSKRVDVPTGGVPLTIPRQGEWTYAHWLNFPNDGWKYEIIHGVLYMSPPPAITHQLILMRLAARLHEWTTTQRAGTVLPAPCGVRLPTHPVPVEPDIIFVSAANRSILGTNYIEGVPDLLVEILSPSNFQYDLETKFRLYEQSGVAEYWVINPWERTVSIYSLGAGENADGYGDAVLYNAGDTTISTVLGSFRIAVNDLFQSISE